MSTIAPQAFALDVNALEAMKRRTREAPGQNDREVATQFEALFLHMALKRMREATPKDGLFDSEQGRMMQSMFDEQLAQQLATPGIGLADALVTQMQRHAGSGAAAGEPGGEAVFTPLAEPWRVFGSTRGEAARSAPAAVVAGGAAGGLATGSAGDRASASGAGGLLAAIRAGASTARAQSSRDALADAPAHVVSFMEKFGDAARAVAEASGLPMRLILGQAALESGWGRREIRTADGGTSHNLFGIKATGGWRGSVADVMTTEYEGGVARKVSQPFRAYESYHEALSDYARLITQTERYRHVVSARDENEAARRIQAAGYATDPAYADKLISVMRQLPV